MELCSGLIVERYQVLDVVGPIRHPRAARLSGFSRLQAGNFMVPTCSRKDCHDACDYSRQSPDAC